MRIQLTDIHESPHRLRDVVKNEAFQELVASLRDYGLLQPIKVRPNEDGYEIIYGHRRTSAMRQLGWTECEAIVETIDDEVALLQAITENLQRLDLSALEEAQIYATLQNRGYSQIRIAKLINRSSSHIASRLSLLQLPPEVQERVVLSNHDPTPSTEQGSISVDSAWRIATAVKSPEEATQIVNKAIDERLNAKEIRELAKQLKHADKPEQRTHILDTPFPRAVLTFGELSQTNIDHIEIASTPARPFHTGNRSIADQFHSKLMWNLKRIDVDQYAHFTIGYSQRNWDQVAELLHIAKVTTLVDARRNAISQYKVEFSKTNLQTAASTMGIQYVHIPDLGIGSEERDDLAETHDYESLFTAYANRLNAKVIKNLLGDMLPKERLAFLCVELDPETCHRHKIALLLEEMGYRTFDL